MLKEITRLVDGIMLLLKRIHLVEPGCLRICLISREYPPDTGWGGIGTYTFNHACALKEQGHDVEVIALAKEGTEISPAPAYDHNDSRSVLVHRAVSGPLLKDLRSILMVVPNTLFVLKSCVALWQKFLSIHTKKPFDVVEAPEHLAEALFPALTHICPLVIRLHTPHSKLVEQRYHGFKDSFDHRLIGILERVVMLEADLLSSPSEALAQYVAADCGINLSDVHIVRNPVDINKFTPDGHKAMVDAGRTIVFFAGRLEERKGIHYLVDAIPDVIRECPNVKFVILGADTNSDPGLQSVLKGLKEKLIRSDCIEAVQFISHVPLDEMPAYYRSADICVVPSLYENAPYTVIEAQATGKPVIGSSAGGTPEYIVDGKTGIVVPPQNSKALAEAIIALAVDNTRRISMGAVAREKTVAELNTNLIVREVVDTYSLAIQKFKEKTNTNLYRRDPQKCLYDFISLMYAYHTSLCDLIYVQSIRFRMKNWIRFVCLRPRLAVAKLVLRAAKAVDRTFHYPQGFFSKVTHSLEKQIAQRDAENHDFLLQQLYKVFALNKIDSDTESTSTANLVNQVR